MKKKALSLLLVAMMCGSMLPANAFATDNADTHANHLICNDSTCEDESHAVQNWQAINNEDDLQKINVAGTYYLDADVIIKKNLEACKRCGIVSERQKTFCRRQF